MVKMKLLVHKRYVIRKNETLGFVAVPGTGMTANLGVSVPNCIKISAQRVWIRQGYGDAAPFEYGHVQLKL